jgi:hypothetical protein
MCPAPKGPRHVGEAAGPHALAPAGVRRRTAPARRRLRVDRLQDIDGLDLGDLYGCHDGRVRRDDQLDGQASQEGHVDDGVGFIVVDVSPDDIGVADHDGAAPAGHDGRAADDPQADHDDAADHHDHGPRHHHHDRRWLRVLSGVSHVGRTNSRRRFGHPGCQGGWMNPVVAEAARALDGRVDVATVVLVEGASDELAVETLAVRLGRDLSAEGVVVLAMGGATNIGHFLDLLGSTRPEIRLAGLCDAAEVPAFRRGLERAGLVVHATVHDLELLGFHICVDDLEDELIRALGPARVEELLEAEGELRSFRIFQQQPAQQGRAPEAQLRRFMGTRSGRKAHYASVLVDALDLFHVPRPLARLVADV